MIGNDLIEALRKLAFDERDTETERIDSGRPGNAFSMIGADILVSHIGYPAGTDTKMHEHPELRITFIREGNAIATIKGKDLPVTRGDVTIVMPGQSHRMRVLDGPLLITELVIS